MSNFGNQLNLYRLEAYPIQSVKAKADDVDDAANKTKKTVWTLYTYVV